MQCHNSPTQHAHSSSSSSNNNNSSSSNNNNNNNNMNTYTFTQSNVLLGEEGQRSTTKGKESDTLDRRARRR